MLKSFILVLLTVVISNCSALTAKAITGDMYVLAYSWQPEFCYGKTTYTGCNPPQDYWTKSFTLHGLWPQYSEGGYPQSCTTEAFDANVPIKVGWSDMTKYWPNAQYAETDPNYDTFWDHEWTKHGTCSGLSQQNYFQDSINLIKSFGSPSILSASVGKNISASDLRNSLGGASKASLQCDSGVYLSGVYTCWTTSSGVPGSQVVCPNDVQKEDTCSASSLVVRSF